MLAFVLAFAPSALADVYKPNKTADHAQDGCTHSDCTLREAISAANGSPSPDVIVLQAGKTYKVTHDPSNVEDANQGGDLDVLAGPLTIKAKGSGLAALDAEHGNRVLDVGPSHIVKATLKDIWIRNGLSNDGAGIRAGQGGTADLTLIHSRVTGSRTIASGDGGGIEVENLNSGASDLKLVRSTISGNKSSGEGGGMTLADIGTATVSASTISGNRAGYQGADATGGGIFAINATTLNLTNSTVAGNSSTASGGGIHVFTATASLRNDSIVGNRADSNNNSIGSGGGIAVATATATVANTIMALNDTGVNAGNDDCAATGPGAAVVPQGRNLLSSVPSSCTAFTVPPNIVQANPHLGKLKSNGGPTKTIALQKGSKAINHAGVGATARDQRGVKRDSKQDIGAFERR